MGEGSGVVGVGGTSVGAGGVESTAGDRGLGEAELSQGDGAAGAGPGSLLAAGGWGLPIVLIGLALSGAGGVAAGLSILLTGVILACAPVSGLLPSNPLKASIKPTMFPPKI